MKNFFAEVDAANLGMSSSLFISITYIFILIFYLRSVEGVEIFRSIKIVGLSLSSFKSVLIIKGVLRDKIVFDSDQIVKSVDIVKCQYHSV